VFEKRIGNSVEVELEEAVKQVHRIAEVRARRIWGEL